jgi:uncharacterized protein (DUF3084 family)
MVNVEVELAVMRNRLARAAQHLLRANEELQDIETRMARLAEETKRVCAGA